MFHQTLCFCLRLYIQHPGNIIVCEKLSIAAHFKNIMTSCKKFNSLTVFACVIRSNGPLRKHGLFSVGLKGQVCRLQLVDFDPCCLFRLWLTSNFLGMCCSFPVIQWSTLSSSRTVSGDLQFGPVFKKCLDSTTIAGGKDMHRRQRDDTPPSTFYQSHAG